jgi:hypothetical protein
MKVRDLKKALCGVDDEMVILLRVSNDTGDEQFMCSPRAAIPDPGCTDTEMFIIDGTDGECEHGCQAATCKEKHIDDDPDR